MGGCFAKNKDIPDEKPEPTGSNKTNNTVITDGVFSGSNKTEASKLDFVTRWKDDICAICARYLKLFN